MPQDTVTTKSQLRETYRPPTENAVRKQLDHIDRHCEAFLALSPFCTLATAGADGRMDCSPRGDMPGFAKVVDPHTLLIPDRPGNNRLDSLSNLVENPEVGLLFMIPGFNETVRVNGQAEISRDAALCAEFAVNRKPAHSVIRIRVREVFFHCAKAFMRSRLWDPDAQPGRDSLPGFGQILADQTKIGTAEEKEAEIKRRQKTHMW